MDTINTFTVGKEILYRELDENQQVTSVLPVRVVQSSSDLIALWLPLGVNTIKPELIEHHPGTPRKWIDGNWYLRESIWKWSESLILINPKEHHATWVRWDSERQFLGWAINMQSKLTLTHLGFDYQDHQLDIIVNPDHSWQWKDEDELELAVTLKRMTSQQAKAVRLEGIAAIKKVEEKASHFTHEWQNWSPESDWSLPVLNEKWNDLSMYKNSELV